MCIKEQKHCHEQTVRLWCIACVNPIIRVLDEYMIYKILTTKKTAKQIPPENEAILAASCLPISSERIDVLCLRRKLCKRLIRTESDTCRFLSPPRGQCTAAGRPTGCARETSVECVSERASCGGCLVPPRRAGRAALQTVAHSLSTSIIHYKAQFTRTGGF